MATTPTYIYEIGFGSGFGTPIASISWTDVTNYVEKDPWTINRGRPDELSEVQPSTLSLTLKNDDGRFTPEYTAGSYYPNVLKGTPIRIRATWNSVTYPRFMGYVDEWPVQWPLPAKTRSTVTVTASSRQARMGRTAPMTNSLSQEILTDTPFAYWPLGDAAESTVGANLSGVTTEPLRIQQEGTGGTVTFGNAIGPPHDGLSAAEVTSTGLDNGKYLRADIPTGYVTDANDYLIIEGWYVTNQATGTLFTFGSSANITVAIRIELDGLTAVCTGSAAGFYIIGPGLNDADGLLHHVALRITPNGANYRADLYRDGVLQGSDATALVAGELDTIGSTARFRVNSEPNNLPDGAFMSSGTYAQVALYNHDVSAARLLERYEAGVTGFEGESSDERFERIAGYAGVPSAEVTTEAGSTSSMSVQDTEGQAPFEALQDVVTTEQGLGFDGKDGGLNFHARSHRYGASSVLTLDHSTQREMSLQPKLDDMGLVNDASVTMPSGYTARIVNAASITDFGLYQTSQTLLTTAEVEVDGFASWLTYLYGDPQVRVPSVTIELIGQTSVAMTTDLLELELGDLITFSNLPTQAPASTMTFFVEGYTETVGFQTHRMTLNLSPASRITSGWRLGTGALGSTTSLVY